MSTVNVEQVSDQAVKITWEVSPTTGDTKRAFVDATRILSASPHPMFVIVDITADPKFPIAATMTGALFGPQMNSKFIAWLVVGTNAAAQLIGRTLNGATGRTKVKWFDTNTQAEDYITTESIAADLTI